MIKKEANKALLRSTSKEKPKMLEWIPNNELQILDMPLKLMTKIPNRLKTMAAKVFDVLLKFRSGKFDMWHFNFLQCEEKSPRFVIPRKFVAIFKLSQKNCVFLI